MEYVIMLLIGAILTGCLGYVNTLLDGLVPTALYAERYVDTLTGTDGISGIFDIFFAFGVSLIILKFLKKGFERYILWTEGDADTEPLILLTGFLKALAAAICVNLLFISSRKSQKVSN